MSKETTLEKSLRTGFSIKLDRKKYNYSRLELPRDTELLRLYYSDCDGQALFSYLIQASYEELKRIANLVFQTGINKDLMWNDINYNDEFSRSVIAKILANVAPYTPNMTKQLEAKYRTAAIILEGLTSILSCWTMRHFENDDTSKFWSIIFGEEEKNPLEFEKVREYVKSLRGSDPYDGLMRHSDGHYYSWHKRVAMQIPEKERQNILGNSELGSRVEILYYAANECNWF